MENKSSLSEEVIRSYLSLVRLGIGHKAEIPETVDWYAVRNLASKQGLAAIVLDGVKRLMESAQTISASETGSSVSGAGSSISGVEDVVTTQRVASEALKGLDLDLKLDWMGESVVIYEQRYEQYRRAIANLAGFYNLHGFKMMILKGYGLSLNYPVPSHRPCGDIDIWQFGQFREADATLSREKGINIDNSHHHHTVFQVDGFLVENHYDIVNVHVYKANAELEKSFKAMAMDDSHFIDLSEYDCFQPEVSEAGKSRVYLPSANLHALFQLKHCISHFASTEITLRHVLDWAFFVEKHSSEIDWKWLVETLRRFQMLEFFNYLNSVCVEDLGFDAGMFATANEALNAIGSVPSFDRELKERVLWDMIAPEFAEKASQGNVFKRVAFKYRRWQANAWKQRLCYSDNRFVAFWKSVWAHILKPSSI